MKERMHRVNEPFQYPSSIDVENLKLMLNFFNNSFNIYGRTQPVPNIDLQKNCSLMPG